MHLPETRSGRIKLGAFLAAGVAAYLLYRQFAPELDLQVILDDIAGTLGEWTYLIVSIMAFLETGAFVGLVAPGETFVVLAGAVAGQGKTNVVLTVGLVWFSAFAGDTASFILGRRLGRGFVLEHGERIRISRERFAQVEEYFDKHGGKTILIGRFIGLVRALAPFIAGSSGMRYPAMAPYSVLGTGLWATFFTLLGYFASRNLEAVFAATEQGLLAFGVLVVGVVATIWVVRRLRVEENRERLQTRMEDNRVGRMLLAGGRRLSPQARFLRDRLTPGDLGIEFTGALAAVAVGAYLFIAYATAVGADPAATALDRSAVDVVERIRADWLTEVERVVTALGSGLVASIVVALAAAALVWRRHWSELGMLLGASVVIAIAVPELKDAFDRPRPPDALVATENAAFPSGHAAFSTVYAWLALIVAVRLRPGWTGGVSLVTAGIALTAAIGLSRVYLGTHFYSDVVGGWALGAIVFGVATAIGISVSHIRNNERDDA